MSLDEIPVDIFVHQISRYLSLIDICHFSMVNNLCHKLGHQQELWKRLVQSRFIAKFRQLSQDQWKEYDWVKEYRICFNFFKKLHEVEPLKLFGVDRILVLCKFSLSFGDIIITCAQGNTIKLLWVNNNGLPEEKMTIPVLTEEAVISNVKVTALPRLGSEERFMLIIRLEQLGGLFGTIVSARNLGDEFNPNPDFSYSHVNPYVFFDGYLEEYCVEGERIVATGQGSTSLKITLDLSNPSETTTKVEPINSIYVVPAMRTSVQFVDRNYVLSITESTTVVLLDWETTSIISQYKVPSKVGVPHPGRFNVIAVSPRSTTASGRTRFVAAGDSSGQIFVWDFETAEFHAFVQGHSYAIHQLIFTEDNWLLSSGMSDRIILSKLTQWQPFKHRPMISSWQNVKVIETEYHPVRLLLVGDSLFVGGWDYDGLLRIYRP